MKIAILGAQGTGKSYLAKAVVDALGERAAGFLLADTKSLMTAIEQDLFSGGSCPDPTTPTHHLTNVKDCPLILVMGLDWPGVADDGDENSAIKRLRVDARLRQVLQAAQLNYVVIYGQGPARTECALQAMAHRTDLPRQLAKIPSPWQWNCDKCSDGACEHRMFTGRLKLGSA